MCWEMFEEDKKYFGATLVKKNKKKKLPREEQWDLVKSRFKLKSEFIKLLKNMYLNP